MEGVKSLGGMSAVKGYGGDPGEDFFVCKACPKLKTLNVPASVNYMYNPSLSYKSGSAVALGFEEIKVDPENETYKDIDGIVYSKDGSELFLLPSGRIKDIVIEEGTKKVTDLSNHYYPFSHIIISASVESCGVVVADTIYCYSTNPTQEGYEFVFGKKIIYVPSGCAEKYTAFYAGRYDPMPRIEEFDTESACIKQRDAKTYIVEFAQETAIDSPTVASDEISAIYSLSGIRQDKLSKGVNLIRTKDGKVRKVMQR